MCLRCGMTTASSPTCNVTLIEGSHCRTATIGALNAPLHHCRSRCPWRSRYIPVSTWPMCCGACFPTTTLGVHVRKLKMAMKIGGEYSPRKIDRSHWIRLAVELGLDSTEVVDGVTMLGEQIPDALADATQDTHIASLVSPTPAALTDAVSAWCRACMRTLGTGQS